MLTSYSRSQFVEKTLTDAEGRQYKAVFFVILEAGEVKGRIVSIRPLAANILALSGAVSDGSICLPCWTSNCAIETPYIVHVAPVTSPYFDIEFIINSQPTRAPSCL